MNLRFSNVILSLCLFSSLVFANSQQYLIRFQQTDDFQLKEFILQWGGKLQLVSQPGQLYKWTTSKKEVPLDRIWDENIDFIEPNRAIRLLPNPSLEKMRSILSSLALKIEDLNQPSFEDNPEILSPPIQASGTDTLLGQCWGMSVSGAIAAFQSMPQGKGIVVAVTDTGVDYNHNDLINNMWRNKLEIPNDGIDNDNNGYVDDIVGWDFYSNDNKPYDLSLSLVEILFQGGNPGHGTHVSGVIAASLNNAQGISGVAPQAKIMALRFISEKGQGTTEAAVQAIDYAVANGARVINASWGGEKDSEPDTALQQTIQRAEAKGVIFVAAAGNGRVNLATGTSAGFDNDNDPKPMIPASYDFPNMVAVAAVDSQANLAIFSNWGLRTVKLGAPGVKILSTVPGNRYQDTIVDLGETLKVTWDGTSMASPFVSGALAVLWSHTPGETMAGVRQQLFSMTAPVPSLSGKVASGGQLRLH